MEKIIARQLIKKTDTSEIMGYELLVQSDAESLYNSSVDSAAANAMTAFLTENSSKIFRDRKTFMTFTPALLFRNTPKIFDKDMIVIQIEDNVVIHPLASILIEKYREEGYHFAINDFQFIPKYFSMLEYVDYIKVKVTGEEEDRERRSLENVVEMAHGFGKEVIATSINTKEAFLLAKEIHTDYVEGAYISDTSVSKVGKMEYLQGNLYQLIMEVTKDELDMEVMEQIVDDNTQFVVIGTGDERYENMFRHYAWKYPNKVSANIYYADEMSHKLYAAADAFLMPSAFEPCGLTQLISFRYGTVPIVRETGGLKDTVEPYNEYEGRGDGFSFANYNPWDMMEVINYAKYTYFVHRKEWDEMVARGMQKDFSWDASRYKYEGIYSWLIGW